MKKPAIIIFIFSLQVLSYSQNLSYVYFSRTCDTVAIVEEKELRLAPDTVFYLISILRKQSSSPALDTLSQWREEWKDSLIRNGLFQLNKDSATKYGTTEQGVYVWPDSCKIFSVRYSNFSYEIVYGPLREFHKDYDFFWSALYHVHTDVELLADTTVLYSGKDLTLHSRDSAKRKRNLGNEEHLKYNATELRTYQSPSSGIYFVTFREAVVNPEHKSDFMHYLVKR